MREILFKAKRANWKELPKEQWWVEGYYVAFNGDHFIACTVAERFGVSTFYWHEIEPETLCQWTGLTDKNGEKIWENDIVKHEASQAIGSVKWYIGDYIGYCVDDIHDGEQQFPEEMFGECEAVGNTFDNADLLED